MPQAPLHIKIIDRARPGHAGKRQLPSGNSFRGKCKFVMERDAKEYDWLVVGDVNRHLSSKPEMLHCALAHTLLTTTEPHSVCRYHVAIENHFSLHHWTEKLADAFLNGCVPICQGCTNLKDYFPEGSYVEIDITKPEQSLDTIRRLLADPEDYDSRRDALREAKRLVIEVYDLPAMIKRIVHKHHDRANKTTGTRLLGRRQPRLHHPLDTMRHAAWHMTRGLG